MLTNIEMNAWCDDKISATFKSLHVHKLLLEEMCIVMLKT